MLLIFSRIIVTNFGHFSGSLLAEVFALKEKDFCRYPTLYLLRMRDVTWTTEFRNTKYARKPQGECFVQLSSGLFNFPSVVIT